MAGHETDDERDPLLVRPFLFHEPGGPSEQTWPSATTREVRSQHALDTAPSPLPAPPPSPSPDHRAAHAVPVKPRAAYRRALVISGVVVGVVATAAVAGFAGIRMTAQPPTAAPPPYSPLPVGSGSALATAVPGTAVPLPSTPARTGGHTGTRNPATGGTGTPAATTGPPATSPAASPSPTGTAATSLSPAGIVAPSPPLTQQVGVIQGENNLCLDLNGGVAAQDNHVQVYSCNGTDAQKWTLATDGTLRVQGMCALVVGDYSVHIVSCDERTTAQWRVAGPVMVNLADALCLTDPSGGTVSGEGVTVTSCTGDADQRWSVP